MNITKTTTKTIKVADLVPNEGQLESIGVHANPRQISETDYAKLLKSLKEKNLTGLLPLKVIEHDGQWIVLGGNMRLRAMQELGMESVSCIIVPSDADAETLNEFIIKDNSTFGEWDYDALANEWPADKLQDWGVDVPEFATDGDDIPKDAQEDAFDPEKDEVQTRVKKGDIWQLGNHRLMCGDSTNAEEVERLMDGETADLVFTDPPYGMKKECDGVLNDNLNYDDLLEFNKKWIPNTFANLKCNGSWYCWGIDEPLMDIYSNILKPMIRRNEITFRNYITWDKFFNQKPTAIKSQRSYCKYDEKCLFVMCGVEGFNNNSDHYDETFEPIRSYLEGEAKKVGLNQKVLKEICGVGMYAHWFTKSQFGIIPREHYEKLQRYFEGRAFAMRYDDMRKLFNDEQHRTLKEAIYAKRAFFDHTHELYMTQVWRFERASDKEREGSDHVTPKPIALCSRGIKSSSRDGEIVLDLFGGSGSTLIACEQLGRKCYMMELDPHYCDVIIARWEKFTGKQAHKTQ